VYTYYTSKITTYRCAIYRCRKQEVSPLDPFIIRGVFKMSFAVCRVKKLKSSDLAAVGGHNMRTIDVPHREPSGQFYRMGFDQNKTTSELVSEKLDKFVKKKVRKDAVVAVELVLSASPEYFRPKNPDNWGFYEKEKVDAWQKKTIDFIRQKYKDSRIADICVHLDEATPHMHVVLVPLQKKQLKKRRTKEQISKNIQAETYESVTLNARDMFDKTSLSQLQTDYAEALKPLGISRGIKHSRAKNKPLKKYYSEIAAKENRLKFDYPVIEKPPIFNTQNWVDENNQNIEQSFKNQQKEILRLQKLANKYKSRYENERNKTKYIAENFATVDEIQKTIKTLKAEIRSLKHLNEQQAEGFKLKINELTNDLESYQSEMTNKDEELLNFKKRYFKLKNEVEKDNDLGFSP